MGNTDPVVEYQVAGKDLYGPFVCSEVYTDFEKAMAELRERQRYWPKDDVWLERRTVSPWQRATWGTPRCNCGADDCVERQKCTEAGAPGHLYCGVCEEHNVPMHKGSHGGCTRKQ